MGFLQILGYGWYALPAHLAAGRRGSTYWPNRNSNAISASSDGEEMPTGRRHCAAVADCPGFHEVAGPANEIVRRPTRSASARISGPQVSHKPAIREVMMTVPTPSSGSAV